MARRSGGRTGSVRPMSRLPYVSQDGLDDPQRQLWDALVSTRGASLVTAEGGLAGPFNAWLYAPDLGSRLAELGRVLRFETSVDRRLLEIAIITTGAHWKAEFEWWAHSRMARQHGVPDDVVAAIAEGDEPPFGDDTAGRAVHAVARSLATSGRLDHATYAAARDALGDRGLVEIVSLCGYYTLVSFTLNAFDVPLPPGATPTFG